MVGLGTSDDIVFVASAIGAAVLLVVGIVERRRHDANLARVPLRISVNGTRGKSTVTRLLTGALAAGGRRPLGKTTGTEARLLLGWAATEEAIHRRPEGPNIGEQRAMVRRAVAEEVDTIVTECMAIMPEYQLTFHRDLVDVNLLVITNALDDHLEHMGPTAKDVAEIFADSIPHGGCVVATPGPYLHVFDEAAADRDAVLLVADPDEVDEDTLDAFDHLVLAEHIALVVEVTRYLGVPDGVALDGLISAAADPYATRLVPIGDPHRPALLVNAFPANDPASTLAIWEHVRDREHPEDGLVVIMNCREDRVPRSRQFARDVLPVLPVHTLVVTGEATWPVVREVEEGGISAEQVHDLSGAGPGAVVEILDGSLSDRVVLCVGNLHGGGAEVIAALEELAVGAGPRMGAV